MSRVAMRRLPDGEMPAEDGDFSWNAERTHCLLQCPGGHFVNLPVAVGAGSGTPPVWSWDGNEDRPTFRPSIRIFEEWMGIQREHWHGWVTAGEMHG